jgi:hypothetical protein
MGLRVEYKFDGCTIICDDVITQRSSLQTLLDSPNLLGWLEKGHDHMSPLGIAVAVIRCRIFIYDRCRRSISSYPEVFFVSYKEQCHVLFLLKAIPPSFFITRCSHFLQDSKTHIGIALSN